ncbi:MAG: cytochrome c-type biogenesis protein [Pseudomonadales bacterium]
MTRSGFAFALLFFCVAGIARAASTVEVHQFDDPALEARYYGLIDELRCPKCQNTNLAGSDAPIAHDLRNTVYRLLVEKGMSDADIRQYLVDRYGDFVLYDPPLRPMTVVLWALPALALIVGFMLLRGISRRPELVALDADEQRRLAALDEEVR